MISVKRNALYPSKEEGKQGRLNRSLFVVGFPPPEMSNKARGRLFLGLGQVESANSVAKWKKQGQLNWEGGTDTCRDDFRSKRLAGEGKEDSGVYDVVSQDTSHRLGFRGLPWQQSSPP